MDLQVQLCALLHATPNDLVGWLHTLITLYSDALPWPLTLIIGPHTFVADAPTPFETLALYVVDKRAPSDIAGEVVRRMISFRTREVAAR